MTLKVVVLLVVVLISILIAVVGRAGPHLPLSCLILRRCAKFSVQGTSTIPALTRVKEILEKHIKSGDELGARASLFCTSYCFQVAMLIFTKQGKEKKLWTSGEALKIRGMSERLMKTLSR